MLQATIPAVPLALFREWWGGSNFTREQFTVCHSDSSNFQTRSLGRSIRTPLIRPLVKRTLFQSLCCSLALFRRMRMEVGAMDMRTGTGAIATVQIFRSVRLAVESAHPPFGHAVRGGVFGSQHDIPLDVNAKWHAHHNCLLFYKKMSLLSLEFLLPDIGQSRSENYSVISLCFSVKGGQDEKRLISTASWQRLATRRTRRASSSGIGSSAWPSWTGSTTRRWPSSMSITIPCASECARDLRKYQRDMVGRPRADCEEKKKCVLLNLCFTVWCEYWLQYTGMWEFRL